MDAHANADARQGLAIEVRNLTPADLRQCILVENSAFENPQHRCSDDKLEWRLYEYPRICMGLFSSPDGITGPVLLAHALSTMGKHPILTDHDMDYPSDWKSAGAASATTTAENRGEDRTVCLHSLAVSPDFHGRGLGTRLLSAFIREMKGLGKADRIALVCEDDLVDYYKRFGFSPLGPSQAQFGGGGWNDMVLDLNPE